ncbi:MAG TPA: hypothetical protein VGF61_25475 [Candidatus Acidoferrum sp.]|jgi:hypothetical protein
MKRARVLLVMWTVLAGFLAPLSAQEKSNANPKPPVATLKVQVTIVEMDGGKKVVNLPYTYYLRAGEANPVSPWTKLRLGSRIPVYVGKDSGMQYIDVGTNIDSRATTPEPGRFDLSLNLERSWVEGDVLVPMEKPAAQATDANVGPFREPIIRQFKTELNLSMRDGQTTQSTLAADPLSGKVVSITVTINVVK